MYVCVSDLWSSTSTRMCPTQQTGWANLCNVNDVELKEEEAGFRVDHQASIVTN